MIKNFLKGVFLLSFSCVLAVGCGGSETSSNSSNGGIPSGNMSANLTWDANQEPDLAGYKVYYGTTSRNYTTPIDVGNSISSTVPNLAAGVQYFFSITAYDTSGYESIFSNEVSRTF